ncbi:hypothetical protein ON010_g18594 [Phytophthora cinnamomi]|nr:hypothetical protein ON010_g18594 [Phytophthora cinnamomi]
MSTGRTAPASTTRAHAVQAVGGAAAATEDAMMDDAAVVLATRGGRSSQRGGRHGGHRCDEVKEAEVAPETSPPTHRTRIRAVGAVHGASVSRARLAAEAEKMGRTEDSTGPTTVKSVWRRLSWWSEEESAMRTTAFSYIHGSSSARLSRLFSVGLLLYDKDNFLVASCARRPCGLAVPLALHFLRQYHKSYRVQPGAMHSVCQSTSIGVFRLIPASGGSGLPTGSPGHQPVHRQ